MSGHSHKAASCVLHLFFKMILSKIFHYITGVCYNWLPFENKLATLEECPRLINLCDLFRHDKSLWDVITFSHLVFISSCLWNIYILLLIYQVSLHWILQHFSQVSSVAQSCPALCDPMDCSMPGFPVHHQLLELTQTHVHRPGNAIQISHSLLSPSPPTFDLSQHQGLS